MAVHVVEAALFRIVQDLVGLGRLLEAFLRLFIAGIAVRMVLQGYLAVRLLDVVDGGVSLHPQNAVVIFFGCHNYGLFQPCFNGFFFVAQEDFFVAAVVDGDVGHNPLDSLLEGKFVQGRGHPQQGSRLAVDQGPHVREFVGNVFLFQVLAPLRRRNHPRWYDPGPTAPR